MPTLAQPGRRHLGLQPLATAPGSPRAVCTVVPAAVAACGERSVVRRGGRQQQMMPVHAAAPGALALAVRVFVVLDVLLIVLVLLVGVIDLWGGR